jgi:CelD/BcsL family acetyltransferase involved in cellulose biosynthesis
MIAAEPRFANPLLTFEFAEAVGSVRADAHIAVYRRAGEPVAFLAHHRTASGLARPIGAPFSDYHALITQPDPGISGVEALATARINRFRYSGLIDPWRVFPTSTSGATAYRVDLERDASDVLADLRARSPEHVRTWLKQARRLAREGELAFSSLNPSRSDLDVVFALKTAQLRAAGLHDVLSPDWVRALMSRLQETDGNFRGVLSTLHLGSRVIAGNFGVRAGNSFHSWITSYDPAYARHSPGSVLQLRNLEAMPSLGLRSWDLGTGNEHFKAPLATERSRVLAGVAATGRASAWDRAVVSGSSRPLTRLARRLEQIAAVEPSLSGRLRAVGTLARDTQKRLSH